MRIHDAKVLGFGSALLMAALMIPTARAGDGDALEAALIMNGVGNIIGEIGDAARGINGVPENVYIGNSYHGHPPYGYPGYPLYGYPKPQPPMHAPGYGLQVIYNSGYQGYTQPQPYAQPAQPYYAPPVQYVQPQQYAPQQYAPQQYAPQQYVQPQQYAPQQYVQPQQYAQPAQPYMVVYPG